jgi:hypothetical protein
MKIREKNTACNPDPLIDIVNDNWMLLIDDTLVHIWTYVEFEKISKQL